MSKRKCGGAQLDSRRRFMRSLVGMKVRVEFTNDGYSSEKRGILIRILGGPSPGYYVRSQDKGYQMPLNYIVGRNGDRIHVDLTKSLFQGRIE